MFLFHTGVRNDNLFAPAMFYVFSVLGMNGGFRDLMSSVMFFWNGNVNENQLRGMLASICDEVGLTQVESVLVSFTLIIRV